MAQICAHCGSADTQAGFDRFQCLSCGGFTHVSGVATVPTSALAADANPYEGPGGEAIPAPGTPPFKATTASDAAGPVPADGSTTDAAVPVEGAPAAPAEEVSASGEVVQQGPQEPPQG